MALAGAGAVAIWHDIDAPGRDGFYAWHGGEHMPERLSIPGFLRGRRYSAVPAASAGAPEFFNLYETASTGVLSGRDYLDRLDHPTPWTRASVRHFRNVARSLCTVAHSRGRGEGGMIATYRYDVAPGRAATHRERMSGVLDRLAERPGIAGAHLLVADEAASTIPTAERQARSGGTEVPPWVVLVEGWGDEAAFAGDAASFAGDPAFADSAVRPGPAIYRLQFRLGPRA